MLQEISQSTNRRNSFSDVALISLLNSNLPAKFSLTGQLTSTDNISGGFYDAGRVRSLQFLVFYVHVLRDKKKKDNFSSDLK